MFETQRPKDTKESATDQDNQLSYQIIGAAIEVHRTLGGPGLLESIYEDALRYELSLQGFFGHRHVKEGIRRVIN